MHTDTRRGHLRALHMEQIVVRVQQLGATIREQLPGGAEPRALHEVMPEWVKIAAELAVLRMQTLEFLRSGARRSERAVVHAAEVAVEVLALSHLFAAVSEDVRASLLPTVLQDADLVLVLAVVNPVQWVPPLYARFAGDFARNEPWALGLHGITVQSQRRVDSLLERNLALLFYSSLQGRASTPLLRVFAPGKNMWRWHKAAEELGRMNVERLLTEQEWSTAVLGVLQRVAQSDPLPEVVGEAPLPRDEKNLAAAERPLTIQPPATYLSELSTLAGAAEYDWRRSFPEDAARPPARRAKASPRSLRDTGTAAPAAAAAGQPGTAAAAAAAQSPDTESAAGSPARPAKRTLREGDASGGASSTGDTPAASDQPETTAMKTDTGATKRPQPAEQEIKDEVRGIGGLVLFDSDSDSDDDSAPPPLPLTDDADTSDDE